MISPVHVDFLHLLCVWGGNIVCICCMILFLLFPKFGWFHIRYEKLVGIFDMLSVDCWTDRSDYHSMVIDKVYKCEPWLSMPGVVCKPPTCSDSHLRISLHSFSWFSSCLTSLRWHNPQASPPLWLSYKTYCPTIKEFLKGKTRTLSFLKMNLKLEK